MQLIILYQHQCHDLETKFNTNVLGNTRVANAMKVLKLFNVKGDIDDLSQLIRNMGLD